MNSDLKESACNAGDPGLIPGLGRSPGEGNGKLLQYSCPENSMARGAWWALVHGVAESDMTEWLTHTHTHTQAFLLSCVLLSLWFVDEDETLLGLHESDGQCNLPVVSLFNCRASEAIWDRRDHISLRLFCDAWSHGFLNACPQTVTHMLEKSSYSKLTIIWFFSLLSDTLNCYFLGCHRALSSQCHSVSFDCVGLIGCQFCVLLFTPYPFKWNVLLISQNKISTMLLDKSPT